MYIHICILTMYCHYSAVILRFAQTLNERLDHAHDGDDDHHCQAAQKHKPADCAMIHDDDTINHA